MTVVGYLREENITGEGVAVELPVAGVGPRILSRLLDMLASIALAIVLYLAVATLLGIGSAPSEAVQRTVLILVLVTVTLFAPATFEVLTRGKSPGRYALGLRVVRDDGGPVTGRQALLRALVALVEIWLTFGAPALVSAMVTPRAKRLGDVAAGTYAISERHAVNLTIPPEMPPFLAGWARSADIAPLPAGLALAIRQYLDRLPRLNPAIRQSASLELLAAVLPLVSPPPPAGAHPTDILAAVLVERRERDAVRLARQEQQRQRFAAG